MLGQVLQRLHFTIALGAIALQVGRKLPQQRGGGAAGADCCARYLPHPTQDIGEILPGIAGVQGLGKNILQSRQRFCLGRTIK
ncbi:MAG: hypothetical protein BroJett011_75450 [Chloroflexota bacterium]|nr:MAG: hypothetical protein BroJett011_75450 [Chloroflexota bacterium]